MGGLTVLKVLDAYIVTMHLTLATAFLLTLYFMKKSLAHEPQQISELSNTMVSRLFRFNLGLGIVFVVVQIVLGGLVAATYSGLVCIDFPTCNGQFFPPMQGPIAIQVMHRLGAYWLSLLIFSIFLFSLFAARKMGLRHRHRRLGVALFFLVCSQIFVGVMNLKYLMPAVLSVFHLALALVIMLTLVNYYYATKIAR
jgi:cytochrome c oxidase assembly protein subunit 15